MGLFDKLLGISNENSTIYKESQTREQTISSTKTELLRGAIILAKHDALAADKIFEEIADTTHEHEALRLAILSKLKCFRTKEVMFDLYPEGVFDFIDEIDKTFEWIDTISSGLTDEEKSEQKEWLARCYELKGKFLHYLKDASSLEVLKKGVGLGSNKSKLYVAFEYLGEAKKLAASFDEISFKANYSKKLQKRIDNIEERVNNYYIKIVSLLEDYVTNYSEIGATAYELSNACRILSLSYKNGNGVARNASKAEWYKGIADREKEKWDTKIKDQKEQFLIEVGKMDGIGYFEQAITMLQNENYEDNFRATKFLEQIADDMIESGSLNLNILRVAVQAKNVCSYAYEHLLSHTDDASLARTFIDEIEKGLYYLDLIESKFDLSEEDRKSFSDLRGRFYEFKGIYLYKINDPSCSYPLGMARAFGSNRAMLYLAFYENDTIEEKDEERFSEMVALLESYISNYTSVGEGSLEPATAYKWLANYYEQGVGVEQDSAKAETYREIHDKLIANYEKDQMNSWNELCQRAPWVTG